MSHQTAKHHANQLVNMASTNALASEFIEGSPKSVAICNLAMGIASTTMTDVQMQALNDELEPVLHRMNEELKVLINKHGIAFSGHGASLIGKAAFPTPEDRANFERDIMPILALKTLLEEAEQTVQAAGEATGSFES